MPFKWSIITNERSYSIANYKYGFNGKEMDNEVSGGGNQYDYGFRIYNPRLGKFLSVDPLFQTYPYYTPYQFAGNKPTYAIDLDGLEELPNPIYDYAKRKGEEMIKKTTDYLVKRIVETVFPSGEKDEQAGSREEQKQRDVTLNNAKTPKGAYISVKGDVKTGIHTRENSTILGVGRKLQIGANQEIISVEFAGNTEEAYLNFEVLNSDPEGTADYKSGFLGAGGTISVPVNPISEEDYARGSAQFSVGPFQFNIPLNKDEKPTMEISITEQHRGKKGISAGFSISIKNIEIISPKEMQESFKGSYNQIQNSYYQRKAREGNTED